MSKKNKFKKFSKAQFLEELKKTETETISDNLKNERQVSPNANSLVNQKNHQASNSQDYTYVKTDLMRIGVVLTLVFILLIAVVVIDKQTTWLSVFTDKLVNTLNLNQ